MAGILYVFWAVAVAEEDAVDERVPFMVAVIVVVLAADFVKDAVGVWDLVDVIVLEDVVDAVAVLLVVVVFEELDDPVVVFDIVVVFDRLAEVVAVLDAVVVLDAIVVADAVFVSRDEMLGAMVGFAV